MYFESCDLSLALMYFESCDCEGMTHFKKNVPNLNGKCKLWMIYWYSQIAIICAIYSHALKLCFCKKNNDTLFYTFKWSLCRVKLVDIYFILCVLAMCFQIVVLMCRQLPHLLMFHCIVLFYCHLLIFCILLFHLCRFCHLHIIYEINWQGSKNQQPHSKVIRLCQPGIISSPAFPITTTSQFSNPV